MLRPPHLVSPRLQPGQPSSPHPGFGPPSSQRNFVALVAARDPQSAGYNSPRAISHPVADSLALSNSPNLRAGTSPRGIFDSPRATLSSPAGHDPRGIPQNPDYCTDLTLDTPRSHGTHPQAHMGPYVSPSRNLPESLPPQLPVGLPVTRPVRRRAAARHVTYSEQLDLGTDSDSDSGPSRARGRRAKQACPQQRPRRQNSKPARFCGVSDSDAASDQEGSPRRKHHNPWSALLLLHH